MQSSHVVGVVMAVAKHAVTLSISHAYRSMVVGLRLFNVPRTKRHWHFGIATTPTEIQSPRRMEGDNLPLLGSPDQNRSAGH